MATPKLSDIQALADSLQVKLDAEQQQVADLFAAKDADNAAKQVIIDGLNTTIETLTEQVADGGTTEERQAVVDKLTALSADLEATVAP